MGTVKVTSSGLGPAVTNTGGYYVPPTYTTTSTGSYGPITIGGDNHTEFGRTFDIPQQMMGTQDFELVLMGEVMRDYQRTKAASFPGWKGFPSIKTNVTMHGLQIAWYAMVPNAEVFNTAEEENLWNE